MSKMIAINRKELIVIMILTIILTAFMTFATCKLAYERKTFITTMTAVHHANETFICDMMGGVYDNDSVCYVDTEYEYPYSVECPYGHFVTSEKYEMTGYDKLMLWYMGCSSVPIVG